MSTPRIDVDHAERLTRVKLSSAMEPSDLGVTGLVSELGAGKVLDYLEAAGEVENLWGFGIGQELAQVDPTKVLEQAAARGHPLHHPRRRRAARPQACAVLARCTSAEVSRSGYGSGEQLT